MKMSESDKKSTSPWLLDRLLNETTGKTGRIRSLNPETFLIETNSKSQTEKLMTIKQLNGKPVEIVQSSKFNSPKGLAYIYDYDLSNFETYKKNLIETLPIKDVVIA